MHDLIEAIRTAVAEGATPEQKGIGAAACRTILAAIDAEPGKPIVLPGAPQPHPLSRVSLDQALDLAIARLTTIAEQRDAASQAPPRAPTEASGPRIAIIPAPSRGLPVRPRKKGR